MSLTEKLLCNTEISELLEEKRWELKLDFKEGWSIPEKKGARARNGTRKNCGRREWSHR